MIDLSLPNLYNRIKKLEDRLATAEVWRGPYIAGRVYVPNEVVMYNNQAYIATSQNFNVAPDSNTTTWINVSNPESFSRPNQLYNALFRVNQKGAAVYTTGGATIADRWHYAHGATYAGNVWSSPVSPSVLKGIYVDTALEWYSSGGAVGGGDIEGIYYGIDGDEWNVMHGQTLTLSWLANVSIPGVYGVSLRSGNVDRSIVHAYTMGSGWQFNTWIIPPTLVGTFGLTSGTAGAYLNFSALCGSTFQTAPDVWVNGNFLAPSGMTNGLTTAGQAMYIALPKLEIGDSATKFITPDVISDRNGCYRQLWVAPGVDGRPCFYYGTSQVNINWEFPVPMRATPAFSCPGLTSIGSIGTPGAAQVENQRLLASAGGTYSSHTAWEAAAQHFTTRLISSVPWSIGATGDVAFAYFGSAVKPTFSAEL